MGQQADQVLPQREALAGGPGQASQVISVTHHLDSTTLLAVFRKKSGKNRRRRRQRQLSVEEEEEEDFDQVPYDDDDDVYGEGFLNVDGVKFGKSPSA